jgi:hypothetical protein
MFIPTNIQFQHNNFLCNQIYLIKSNPLKYSTYLSEIFFQNSSPKIPKTSIIYFAPVEKNGSHTKFLKLHLRFGKLSLGFKLN